MSTGFHHVRGCTCCTNADGGVNVSGVCAGEVSPAHRLASASEGLCREFGRHLMRTFMGVYAYAPSEPIRFGTMDVTTWTPGDDSDGATRVAVLAVGLPARDGSAEELSERLCEFLMELCADSGMEDALANEERH